MRLLRRCICISVAAVPLSGAALAGTAVATVTPPRAKLTRYSCTQALDPDNRSVGIWAVMRPLEGTLRMAIRFDLLQRVGTAPPAAVRAGDLGVWVTPPDPTLGQVPGDVWRLDKSVIDLAAPATYQFRVRFRWFGAAGHVLGTVTRYSHRCRQPELRPDLAVTSLKVSPLTGQPTEDQYLAVIANKGQTAAGPFEVLFVPGGNATATTDDIPSLGPGQSQTLSFIGPVCDPANPPRVTADAAHQVDDYSRANNTATAVCPTS